MTAAQEDHHAFLVLGRFSCVYMRVDGMSDRRWRRHILDTVTGEHVRDDTVTVFGDGPSPRNSLRTVAKILLEGDESRYVSEVPRQ